MALPATGAPRPGIMVGSTSEFSLSSGQHTCLHFHLVQSPNSSIEPALKNLPKVTQRRLELVMRYEKSHPG